MIDLSNVKAPGWQRVVAELNAAAPDDRSFLERLVRILAQVSAARQAVLFAPDRTDGEEIEPRVELIYPPVAMNGAGASGGDESDAPAPKARAKSSSASSANDTSTGSGTAGGVEFAKDVKVDEICDLS